MYTTTTTPTIRGNIFPSDSVALRTPKPISVPLPHTLTNLFAIYSSKYDEEGNAKKKYKKIVWLMVEKCRSTEKKSLTLQMYMKHLSMN